jgi:UbiD family decarboxylase
MPFKDLREFIAKLEEEGEAIKIKEEVDWNLEASAILRKSAEEGLPAPIFQKIKGYPQGYRLFGNSANSFRRMAISMDLKPDTHPREHTKKTEANKTCAGEYRPMQGEYSYR